MSYCCNIFPSSIKVVSEGTLSNIMDACATQHMTYRKEFFWSYQDCHLNSIILVDDTTHTPQGKGSVKVFLPRIWESIISNVWYVPSFKKTLLSLILIHHSSHQRVIEDGKIKINSIKDNYKIVMTGYEDGKLLRMKGIITPRMQEFAGLVETSITPIRLWHARFGHLNADHLFQLQKQGMVNGLPTF